MLERVYFDLPQLNHEYGNGSLLTDFIRKSDSRSTEESAIATISIIATKLNKWHIHLKDDLSRINERFKFECIDTSDGLEETILKIRNSNVVIPTDQFSNVLAAMVNCPLVNVFKKSLFTRSNNRVTCINSILNTEVVKNIESGDIKEISDELYKLLNDHNYSATMLNEYQHLKDKIGTQPFARVVAQEIVEWGEE